MNFISALERKHIPSQSAVTSLKWDLSFETVALTKITRWSIDREMTCNWEGIWHRVHRYPHLLSPHGCGVAERGGQEFLPSAAW